MLNIFKNNFYSHAQLPMGRVMFMIQRDASAYLMNHRHAKVMGTSSRNILCIIKSLVGLNIIFIKPTKSFSEQQLLYLRRLQQGIPYRVRIEKMALTLSVTHADRIISCVLTVFCILRFAKSIFF